VALLITVSVVDLEFQLIPDILSLGGIVAGLLLSLIRPGFSFVDSLLGVAVGGGILFAIAYGYQFITKREGMGGGDIKLIAMVGAFCGIKGVIFSIVGGSLLGTLVGIPLMLIKGKDSKYAIPFGPFLSAAAIVFIFRGQNIIFAVTDILMHR
jgi:leader peptidase (prepilin peptidase) / N-methyltransferase